MTYRKNKTINVLKASIIILSLIATFFSNMSLATYSEAEFVQVADYVNGKCPGQS